MVIRLIGSQFHKLFEPVFWGVSFCVPKCAALVTSAIPVAFTHPSTLCTTSCKISLGQKKFPKLKLIRIQVPKHIRKSLAISASNHHLILRHIGVPLSGRTKLPSQLWGPLTSLKIVHETHLALPGMFRSGRCNKNYHGSLYKETSSTPNATLPPPRAKECSALGLSSTIPP